ncbi:MAG: hypothetical protein R3C12_15735 [Planctomycetaceae bacterium]
MLLERFGSPAGILQAARRAVFDPGHRTKNPRGYVHNHADMARRELEECRHQLDIHALSLADENYPVALREIADPHADSVPAGALLPADQLAVAIVSSRNCTMYGRMAEQLSAGLALRGYDCQRAGSRVDSFIAALQAGGQTVASVLRA